MRTLELRTFAGRNVYIHRQAALALIDLEDLRGRETREFPEFNQRLLAALPGLCQHGCASGDAGGFRRRMEQGTYFGHALEHTILELQSLLGLTCKYGKTMATDRQGVYEVVFECPGLSIAEQLVQAGLDLLHSCLGRGSFELPTRLTDLRRRLARGELGPSTAAIAAAAKRRGISVSRIGNGSLLQLGTGCFAHRVQATLTGNTSCLAADIAGDKSLTKLVLQRAGIPVPHGCKLAADEGDQAVAAWRELDCPVVIKPCDGNQGKGVSLNLNTETGVREAVAIAARYGCEILVEEHINGRHYRLLVIGGELVAASERIPAHVLGDGHSTVQQLVELVNQDPNRGEEHDRPLTRIIIDDVARSVLHRQGYSAQSIPTAGTTVWLRDNANLSTGGTAVDVTEQVNPQLMETVVRAVRLVGLDVAGVDLVCPDIAQPLQPRSGAIIEINAAPGIRMHHYPVEGQSRDVADLIVTSLFPPGARSEVPLVAVTGTNGKTTTSRLIAHTLRLRHQVVGLTSTEGIYLNDRCIVSGDTTGPWSANVVLGDPAVEAAVLEVARGGLIRGGLAYDLADVAVLTNISEDHLGQDNLETLEDLVWVKSLVVEAVRPQGHVVLNADDACLPQLLPRLRSQATLFSLRSDNLHVRRQLGAGGRAAFVVDGSICLAVGDRLEQLVDLRDVPLTWSGRATCNIGNALAAAAALWGLGVDNETIGLGLRTFLPASHNPGRQTLRTAANRSVLIDYAHNVAGIQSLCSFARGQTAGRLLGVIAAPGDRRSATIFRVGQSAGRGFDRLYIKEDQDRRGRPPGEVAELLRQGAIAAGLPGAAITVVLQEAEALRAALLEAGPDDLVVVLYEHLELTLELLQALDQEIGGNRKYVVAEAIDLA